MATYLRIQVFDGALNEYYEIPVDGLAAVQLHAALDVCVRYDLDIEDHPHHHATSLEPF